MQENQCKNIRKLPLKKKKKNTKGCTKKKKKKVQNRQPF